MQAAPPGFPVPVRVASAAVGGAPIDLIVSDYEEGVLLIATQLGTVGTVLECRCVCGGRGAEEGHVS
jgi:hypothetical protein